MINYIYYKNEKASKTILLLHGWGVSSSYMESLKDYLKKDYSILLVDLPGHGKSDLEKVYGIEDYLNTLFMIVCKENITNLYGVGHSFGGKLLSFYSLKYKLNGMILLAPSSYKPRFSIIKFIKVTIYKILKRLHLPIPSSLQGSRDYKNTSGLKRKTFLKVCHSYLKKEQLKRIKIPTIIVGFKDDKEVKKYQLKKLNRYIAHSKLFMYDGTHFSYFEHYSDIRKLLILLERGKDNVYF